MSSSSVNHSMPTSVSHSTLTHSADPGAHAPPATRGGARARSRRIPDGVLLFAVIAVVCLVSLPRLEDYVLRTNEADAQLALVVLGGICFPQGSRPTPAAEGGLGSLWLGDESLRHRLGDARPVEGTQDLLFHGYFYRLERDAQGRAQLLAWPRKVGRTGTGTYTWRPVEGVIEGVIEASPPVPGAP